MRSDSWSLVLDGKACSHPCSTGFRLTWQLAPGLPFHPELWVVITVVGFAFEDLDGLTPVQAWNSCLEQRMVATLHRLSHHLP